MEVKCWILRGLEGRRQVRVWGRGEEIGVEAEVGVGWSCLGGTLLESKTSPLHSG